jgi:hypothetical protein
MFDSGAETETATADHESVPTVSNPRQSDPSIVLPEEMKEELRHYVRVQIYMLIEVSAPPRLAPPWLDSSDPSETFLVCVNVGSAGYYPYTASTSESLSRACRTALKRVSNSLLAIRPQAHFYTTDSSIFYVSVQPPS